MRVVCCSPWSPSCPAGWPPLLASTWTDTGTPWRTWCPCVANPSTSLIPTPSTRTWTTSAGWQPCVSPACRSQRRLPWARLQSLAETSIVTLTLAWKYLNFHLLLTQILVLFLVNLQLRCQRTALLFPWWVKMSYRLMKILLLHLLANPSNDL